MSKVTFDEVINHLLFDQLYGFDEVIFDEMNNPLEENNNVLVFPTNSFVFTFLLFQLKENPTFMAILFHYNKNAKTLLLFIHSQ
jgi:hypothetical protein